jgi:hypothetical protein
MAKRTNKQILELNTALRWKMPGAQCQRIQMVSLRGSGTQPAIAEATGVSLGTVDRAGPQRVQGAQARRQRENMTIAEKALLARFAKDAGQARS